MTALAPILEAFFTDRLMTQRGASPHTIASYRDSAVSVNAGLPCAWRRTVPPAGIVVSGLAARVTDSRRQRGC
jgi:hypothetical protein